MLADLGDEVLKHGLIFVIPTLIMDMNIRDLKNGVKVLAWG